MHSLTCRLPGLGISGDDDLMMECLYQNLVFMPLLINVTNRILSERSGSNHPLLFTFYD